ncbi:MAG: NADH-ubiquinone oxidoreductase-F iron-sulfur binding region domain-containing protein [Acidobacteriota bacterium]|nr:NADH-ubiquinone oxidoreductase-F iron-sulfur binding region domain-containing protein [Acidobacteriota bacterium]
MAFRTNVLVCAGTGCVSGNSFATATALENEIFKKGLVQEVQVIRTGCQGFCAEGPIVIVQPDGVFYCGVKAKDAAAIVEEHLIKGRPVKKLMYTPPTEKGPIPALKEIPFFAKQKLVVLRNRGVIDPEKIDDYIAVDGYVALEKALFQMTPEQIIGEIKRSGLRGRGGGGFPAGVKWETCRRAAQHRAVEPVLVCNADEGDPGAFMDRSIIESDPHSVIEGMIIGARAIGCREGFVYIRHEYPIARERLLKAIDQARDYGLLGKDILGSGMDFDIEIVQGAGAFVCGESTALMASLEGNVGEPRAKYIHTVEYGYKNRPTNLNNVETWANVPLIISRGSQWFNSMGTGNVADNPWNGSSGTKVFSMVGKINNTGLIEVPMGISLREIIFDIGGGIPGGRKFKAVQTGGPSGGCLPESHLDMPVDFDSLTEAGSMMGSGGMIVMDDHTCMVDVARYFISFLTEESCGKCTPCREGLRTSLEILERITQGKGLPGDLELLQETAEVMQDCCLCALGTSAPNPVLSTIRYFKNEYEAHIKEHRCPGGVCKELIEYAIDPEKCDGCHACFRGCSVQAISGEVKKTHTIDKAKCVKCGACIEACKREAIHKVPRSYAA